ncbi:MAG: peptidylprolyl isomerase [bacterium]|nr:peptidylprolyl isomerase [bacterium]
MRALLRSPLLHFVSLGTLVYGAQAVTQAPPGDPRTDREIEIEASVLAELDRRFAETMGRGPSPEERDRMIAAEVEEEILFREAVARGLLERDGGVQTRLIQKMLFLEGEATLDDAPSLLARAVELDLHREDVVVRRILVQKMRLLGGRLGDDQAVTPAEIEERYAGERDRLRAPDRITFSQVFVSRDRPGIPRDRARTVLETLVRTEASAADGPAQGDPFPLGHHLTGRSRHDLDRTFGPRFGEGVFAAAEAQDGWTGPIESAYGYHLVRVDGIEAGAVPPLDLVADRLRLEIEEERRQANLEALISDLRTRYRVRAPSAADPAAPRSEQETG